MGIARDQCSMDPGAGGMGRRAMRSFTEAKLVSNGPQVPRANTFSLVTTGKKSVLLVSLGSGIGWDSTQ